MKDLIKRILLEEQEGPLSRREILLFKYINDNKQDVKNKKNLIKFIEEALRYFALPVEDVNMYYETYTANFRPDGDYENLTKENFKDYRQFKQRKTPNNSAYEYTSAKIPFKGSNLEGHWDVNRKNEWYYVVESYGWYPIYLFINNQWYRTLDTYSSSTRKQISHSDPGRYNSQINANVIPATKGEMERLMSGTYTLSDVEENRVTFFVENKDKVIGLKKLISGGWGGTPHRVSFTITDIDNVDGKIKIFVKINKAGRMVNRKMVSDEDYQNNPQLVSEIENTIKQDIIRSYPKYLTNKNTEIEIIH
jgi:hypothetical protein